MNSLEVFLDDIFVGVLSVEDEKYIFSYDRDYDNFAISPHILPHKKSASKTVKNFLENSLPEGRALEDLVNFTKASKNNIFALIKAVGGESSGALRFGKIDKDREVFREITKKELSSRIDNIQNEPITIWDKKVRFSLAGVQDKLAVIFKGDKFGLADGSLSSTHILKFDTNRFKHITLNEFFCMNLAKRCGLKVANTTLLKVDNHDVLVVERFDRKVYEDKIKRVHIIDGCQMLDLPSSYKYERNLGSSRDVKDIKEGVSFKKLFEVADMLKVPAIAKLTLLRWALFNLIIANSDAHGKNLSFFVHKSGYEITPFYDLLNITIYENIEHSLAMAFGDEFEVDDVLGYDLVDFACSINLPKQLVSKELKQIAKNILDSIEIEFAQKLDKDELQFINELKGIIVSRAKKYLSIADEMIKVSY